MKIQSKDDPTALQDDLEEGEAITRYWQQQLLQQIPPTYPPGVSPDDPRIDLSDPDWIAILYPQLDLFE
jgi:hypothetical protein